MKRKDFIKKISLLATIATMTPFYSSSKQNKKKNMTIRLLRNATLVIEINNKKLLIDPLLAPKSTYDPIIWTSNGIRNPTVNLPIDGNELQQIIKYSDAVLVTHTHNDHWDVSAQQLIPQDKLIIGQPEDEVKFRKQGFSNIKTNDNIVFDGITIIRTKGHHGKGEIGEKMAPVSGFIIKDQTHTLYIAGDTIWCKEVDEAIRLHRPDFIVLNAGGAKFDMGDPIIMGQADVLEVCKASNAKKIICVHMEALNHCYLKREDLKLALKEVGEHARCIVPDDGEKLLLN